MSRSPLLWQRHCPACDGDKPIALHLNRLEPIDGFDMSYEVCRCGQCGFHYAARLPAPATYANYYQRLSKYDALRDKHDISALDRFRAQVAVRLCLPHLPTDSGIADLGCGVGTLLDDFRQAGFLRVMGLDPAPDAASRARDILGLDQVKTGYFHQASDLLPMDKLGLVCLTGVLEHLPEARKEMADLLAKLPTDTRVLLEVPALERFSGADTEPFGEFSLEHIQYFSQTSLTRFMASFGFSPVALEIVDLVGATDSLFGLFFRADTNPLPDDMESPDPMDSYLAQSRRSLNAALARIAAQVSGPFLIYGAGSHTVRLLPELAERGLLNNIRGIVDGNPNLQGKYLAGQKIMPPSSLAEFHGMPVLVSSHKAQDAIARTLSSQHPLILMY